MTTKLHRWHVVTTAAVIVLTIATSLVGLFREGHYRAPPGLVDAYQMQDLAMLLVGVPVLTLGLWYAVHNTQRGRIVWLGGLAYMTYMWASIAIQIPFNEFFLVYVALFSLSLFTLVGGLLTTDAEGVQRALDGRLNTTVYSGALVVIGLGLATLWLSDIVPPLLRGTTPSLVTEAGPQAMASHVLDLGVVVPSILLAAVWLSRERPWGYVLAGVVLVLGSTLAAPIGLMTVTLMLGGTVTVSPIAAVFTFVPILAAAVFAVTYILSMAEPGPTTGDQDRRQSV
jgi:hypothetical protein